MLNALLNPALVHVAYALAGAAFGWWVKRHPDVIPPELAAIVKLLVNRTTVFSVPRPMSVSRLAEANAGP